MELRLHDTMSKEKRPFRPLDPKNVRMYVCGPTVYDFAHIGNARPVIVFDVLFRLLRHVYGDKHVTYVRNITDVDDKINDRAARDYPELPLNEAIRKVTELTGSQFHADVDALGALRPTVEPRATEHIAEMRTIIEKLIANRNAYVEQDHVLFSVGSMKDYGKLSRRSLDEMIAGARVDVAPYKRDAMDFVLWKPSKAGEPSWPSPGGIKVEGRPGWHIECSAMAWKHLGEQFDIHGGGIDLVFPHHENEIAQSCCAFHSNRMAQVWMHNGFLQVEGDKMSKSLGNFITIRELLNKWPGDVLRLQMLMTHYRSPIDWTEARTAQANAELHDWASVLMSTFSWANVLPPATEVAEVLADDLDTPNAITRLREMYVRARKGGQKEQLEFAANCRLMGFRNLDKPGLFEQGASGMGEGAATLLFENIPHVQALRAAYANSAPMEVISSIRSDIERSGFKIEIRQSDQKIELVFGDRRNLEEEIDELIKLRTEARARKDFKESDRIRDKLDEMGVSLKDEKDANGDPITTWKMR